MSEPDTLGRRLWAALLTGVPFGIFKIGGGVAAAHDVSRAAGLLLVAWGALDIVLNLGALLWPRQVSWCALSNLGRWLDHKRPRPGHEQLLLAVDTLLSFVIVATMIWWRRFGSLPGPLMRLWNVAVIANILGVGLERVWRSWRARTGRP